nr:EOG090X0CWG [Ilyocryptus agilis]
MMMDALIDTVTMKILTNENSILRRQNHSRLKQLHPDSLLYLHRPQGAAVSGCTVQAQKWLQRCQVSHLLHFQDTMDVHQVRKIGSGIRLKLQEHGCPPEKEHDILASSNLISLEGIVDTLEQSPDPVAVLKTFQTEDGPHSKIEVDIVCNGGAVWRKVVARKAEALEDISKGRTSSSQKCIVDKAKAYIKCAALHPHHFQPPKVIFSFCSGITASIANKISKLGVEIEGTVLATEPDDDFEKSGESDSISDDASSSDENSFEQDLLPPIGNQLELFGNNSLLEQNKLFLDITCMVGYVSSMTNGGAYFHFPRTIYNQQACRERENPTKPILDTLFHNKHLVTCNEALRDFQTIVNTVGGPGEQKRAEELIQRIYVVEDSPSERVLKLRLSSNVKPRSRLIFGTADHLRIVIVTANVGFIRSAAGQGVEVAHYLQEPRVLTEQQEPFSFPISE